MRLEEDARSCLIRLVIETEGDRETLKKLLEFHTAPYCLIPRGQDYTLQNEHSLPVAESSVKKLKSLVYQVAKTFDL